MMNNAIAFFAQRGLMINLISIFLVGCGLYIALNEIRIESFPNVDLDIIEVSVGYPGASPKEIEQLVITPIEQELKALQGIDRMVSMSFSDSGNINLQIDPGAANRTKLSSEIALAIDRADLPADLPNKPIVYEIAGSVFPVLRLSVSAPRDALAMDSLGKSLKDDILAIEGVASMYVLGDRKREYSIVVDPDALKKQRLSIGAITEAIRGWNLNAPGGDINTASGQQSVRIVGEFTSLEDARDLVIRANDNGDVLKLSDIADVREGLTEATTLHDVGGEPALSLLVLKKSDADIIDTVERVNAYADSIVARYGDDIEVESFSNAADNARTRLTVLTNNGITGIVLVFITLLLFLRLSVALTTTWGLPIVFMAGFMVLGSLDITLNLISMLGFIIVLGMVVDDAIIIGENITHHMERGKPPVQAAIDGAIELLGPVTTTILTTIAAFLPMVFMSGIIGKFIVAIPIVVIALLILSWAESFFILPSHVAHVTNAKVQTKEKRWLRWVEESYAKILLGCLRLRWLTLLFSFLMLAAAVWLAKTSMSFQLFPTTGVDEYTIKVAAPRGTSLEQMREHLRDIDRDIRDSINTEHLEATLSKAGDISADESDALTQRGDRYGQVHVIYVPSVNRPGHNVMHDMFQIEKNLSARYPDLDISATERRPGPPVGRALEVEIHSNDEANGELAARRLMDWLATVDGVTTIDSGLKSGDDEIHAIVDRKKATYAGVDLATVANHVRAAVGGLVVSTIRRGDEEIDVTIRYPTEAYSGLSRLHDLLIPNKQGGLVPLGKIARFQEYDGFSMIRHKDGLRVNTVVADVDPERITSATLNAKVREHETSWLGDLHGKVNANYAGEDEKNRESMRSLIIAFGFALIGIFFILAIQFNNLSYPVIVMLAIPFGAIGIIASFYLHDLYWKPMPLSFFAGLGLVALTGVVVNASLILLVFVQRAQQQGTALFDAIIMAGRRRIRAVLLTATTTVVGLIPTAYGWGGLDHFVSPMALALSWGLIFATLITLITIPAALACLHDVRNILGLKQQPGNPHQPE